MLQVKVEARHNRTSFRLRAVFQFMPKRKGPSLGNESPKDDRGVESSILASLSEAGVRTELKHRGILPNVGVVSDLLPIVESFCKEVARQFLNQDYDEISLRWNQGRKALG
jgi:hypothetical protein